MKAQEKADELFEQGQYARAMTIYRKDLAPVGDKYAQYMVGYMHLAGRGVPEDPILASAWYRLAAERGEESFVAERDTLLQYFKEEHKAISNRLYADLRRELGDLVLISKLIADDLILLRQSDRKDAGNQLIPFGIARFDSASENTRELRRQIESRMTYLTDIAELREDVSIEEKNQIARLEEDVRKLLELTDSRR